MVGGGRILHDSGACSRALGRLSLEPSLLADAVRFPLMGHAGSIPLRVYS